MITLKLFNLKTLFLSSCENITFSENSTLNIMVFHFSKYILKPQKYLFKFPKLEECSFDGKQDINNVIDFSSLKNIKIIRNIKPSDFLNLEGTKLEEVEIIKKNTDKLTETKILEKLLSINTLKKTNLLIKNLNNDDISAIKGVNISVEKLEIYWENECDCVLYNLQNKFPNLTNLYINSDDIYYELKGSIEIKENANYKINDFSLDIGIKKNIKFYCGLYENLIKVAFNINYSNIEDMFPIFNKNCNTSFTSLNTFSFYSFNDNEESQINKDILLNLYNNIDKMPNLKKFFLKCISKDISYIFYEKLIKKLLLTNLSEIELEIKSEFRYTVYIDDDKEYSLEELKQICPEVNFLKFKKLNIKYNI